MNRWKSIFGNNYDMINLKSMNKNTSSEIVEAEILLENMIIEQP